MFDLFVLQYGMTTLADRTVLPPDAAEVDPALSAMAVLLAADHPVTLVDPADESSPAVPVPDTVRAALRQIVDAMTHHQAVTVTGTNTVLTTQQAADLLGVSRPTLIRLLESGQLAYTTPSRHRRVRLDDVLDFQRRGAAVRRHEIEAMTQEAAEQDGFAAVNGFPTTR